MTAATETRLSPEAHALFIAYASDAGNWGGTPLVGGNVAHTKQCDGYLTAIKGAGLARTEVDSDNRRCVWMLFTDAGRDYARAHGVEIHG